MTRRAKPISLTNARYSNRQKVIRSSIERNLISGGMLEKSAPIDWTDERKNIYNELYSILEPSGVLANVDRFTIMQACIIIDRVRQIDALIDKQGVIDKELRICRSDYFNQYLAITSVLCLSNSNRVKLGLLINDNKKHEQDPLLRVLSASEK